MRCQSGSNSSVNIVRLLWKSWTCLESSKSSFWEGPTKLAGIKFNIYYGYKLVHLCILPTCTYFKCWMDFDSSNLAIIGLCNIDWKWGGWTYCKYWISVEVNWRQYKICTLIIHSTRRFFERLYQLPPLKNKICHIANVHCST